ncbi:hypothetical protein [Planomicrobium sp. CPCC 101110]|nr:hypothetical protein [Planomicrobium sp. CPCC 101110]
MLKATVDAVFSAWYYFNVMFVAHLCYNRSNRVISIRMNCESPG